MMTLSLSVFTTAADTNEEQAQALAEAAEELFGDCEVELQYGGQPIYYYMMSVE